MSKSCAALGERAKKLGSHFIKDPHFPFSEATFIDNPGPGKYGKDKGVNLRSLILEEESVRYPFNSSSARILSGSEGSTLAPGPGSYNPNRLTKHSPLNNTSSIPVSDIITSYTQHQPNLSPFGSSISRFKFSYVDDSKKSPGPGEYTTPVSKFEKSMQ